MKKVFVLFLMAGAISFASCGGEKKAEESTETTAPAETTQETEAVEDSTSSDSVETSEAAEKAPAQ
jgi:uncharacterized Zn finger protein (UPF0148 family)